jgi:large conductance mechanosensitive channel
MPFVSLFTPVEKGYAGWTFVFNGVEIPYGVFLGEVINFLIVAAAMFFFIVKFLGWMMNVKKEEPSIVLTKQEELLIEIRDLLKAKVS